jgi:AcrR family transcriptional regulator
MPIPTKPADKKTPRATRSDGNETRSLILQTAGRLFAERGYERTTSKEICAAAGTNIAAVNYHFGNKEGLYAAVLVEAHAQLIQLDDLQQLSMTPVGLQEKLKAMIGLFVQRPAPDSQSWGLSVLIHELMAPSGHITSLLQKAVVPKIQVMLALVGQILELPSSHPGAQRGLAFVVLPCIMLAVVPKIVLQRALPTLTADTQSLIDDLSAYAWAGLQSIKQKHQLVRRLADT